LRGSQDHAFVTGIHVRLVLDGDVVGPHAFGGELLDGPEPPVRELIVSVRAVDLFQGVLPLRELDAVFHTAGLPAYLHVSGRGPARHEQMQSRAQPFFGFRYQRGIFRELRCRILIPVTDPQIRKPKAGENRIIDRLFLGMRSEPALVIRNASAESPNGLETGRRGNRKIGGMKRR
jgi:hypothetical protein